MRLDHLLSKELLAAAGVRAYGHGVVVSVAHCAGVCSAVGAHGWNINESNLFGMAFTGCVLVPVRQFCVLFGGVVLLGKLPGRGVCGVVFGALLGPEATGPFCSNAEGIFWCFFCSCFRYPGHWYGPRVCVGCGGWWSG